MSNMSKGQTVHVWSEQFKRWCDDGVVLEAHANGAVKVQYNQATRLTDVLTKNSIRGRWRRRVVPEVPQSRFSMQEEEIQPELVPQLLRVMVPSKLCPGSALLLLPLPSNRFALGELVAVWSENLGAWQLDGHVQHISSDGSVTVQYSNGTAEKQVPTHDVHHSIQKIDSLPQPILGRFAAGQQVSVWSASHGAWFEDGTVETELSGFIKIRYNNGASAKEVLNVLPNDAIKAKQPDAAQVKASATAAASGV